MLPARKLKPVARDRMRPPKGGEGYVYYTPENDSEAITCAEEVAYERRFYSVERLNEGQRRIYDHMHANPRSMAIIQAGPGG